MGGGPKGANFSAWPTDALLAAAAEIFQQVGYEKATTAEISKRANVAEGTLFLHFKSKLGLMHAMMISFYRELYEEGLALSKANATSIECFHNMLEHYLSKLESNWQTIKIFGYHGRVGDADSMGIFHDLNKHYTDLYLTLLMAMQKEGLLKTEITPHTVRDTLFGSIEHFAISHFVNDRKADSSEFLKKLLALVFEGALTEKSQQEAVLTKINHKLDRLLARQEG